MKKKELNKLADILDAMEPEHFNMHYWSWSHHPSHSVSEENMHDCGTTVCMAGVYHVSKGRSISSDGCVYSEIGEYLGTAERLARKELDLTPHQTSSLFFLSNWPWEFTGGCFPTPQHAAAVIRYFVSH